MGNRVNPVVLRLGYTRVWSDSFYVINKSYARLMHDLIMFKAFIIFFMDRFHFYKIDLYYSHSYLKLIQNKLHVHLYLYEVYDDLRDLRNYISQYYFKRMWRVRKLVRAAGKGLPQIWQEASTYFIQTHFFFGLQEALALKLNKKEGSIKNNFAPFFNLGKNENLLNDSRLWSFLQSKKVINYFFLKKYLSLVKERKKIVLNKTKKDLRYFTLKGFGDEKTFLNALRDKIGIGWFADIKNTLFKFNKEKDKYVFRHPIVKFITRNVLHKSFKDLRAGFYSTADLDNFKFSRLKNLDEITVLNQQNLKHFYKNIDKLKGVLKDPLTIFKKKGMQFYYYKEFTEIPNIFSSSSAAYLNMYLNKKKYIRENTFFIKQNIQRRKRRVYWNSVWMFANLGNQLKPHLYGLWGFNGKFYSKWIKKDLLGPFFQKMREVYSNRWWGSKYYFFNIWKQGLPLKKIKSVRKLKSMQRNNLLLMLARKKVTYLNQRKYTNTKLRNLNHFPVALKLFKRVFGIFLYNRKVDLHRIQHVYSNNVKKFKGALKVLRANVYNKVYNYHLKTELLHVNDLFLKYEDSKNFLIQEDLPLNFFDVNFLRAFLYNDVHNMQVTNTYQMRGKIIRLYFKHNLFMHFFFSKRGFSFLKVFYYLDSKKFSFVEFLGAYKKARSSLKAKSDVFYLRDAKEPLDVPLEKRLWWQMPKAYSTRFMAWKRKVVYYYSKFFSNRFLIKNTYNRHAFSRLILKFLSNKFVDWKKNFLIKLVADVSFWVGKTSRIGLGKNFLPQNLKRHKKVLLRFFRKERFINGFIKKVLNTGLSGQLEYFNNYLTVYKDVNLFAEEYLDDMFNLDKETFSNIRLNPVATGFLGSIIDWFDRGKWNNRHNLFYREGKYLFKPGSKLTFSWNKRKRWGNHNRKNDFFKEKRGEKTNVLRKNKRF